MKCAKDFKKLPGSAFKHKRCDRQRLNREVEAIKKVTKQRMDQDPFSLLSRISRAAH
jgi:hypothetical protein